MENKYEFQGWVAADASACKGNMIWKEYEPKTGEETDIDVRITHSGMCGTDLHTLHNSWVKLPSTSCDKTLMS